MTDDEAQGMSQTDSSAHGAAAPLTTLDQGLRLLVETIPTPVWSAGPEGNIEYVNRRALEYFGAPLEDIVGGGWVEKVHPDDVAFKTKTWLTSLESGTSHDAVCRFRAAGGQYRWCHVSGAPLRSSDGRILRWYGVLIDIEDRRRAEEALRESEYKLRQIIETVPAFLWATDPDGEPTHISQRVFDYSGLRLEDFKHGGWQSLIHPDDFPDTSKAFYHAIQTATPYRVVHRLRRLDGAFRWHYAHGEPLRNQQGRVIQWYGLSFDVDERKHAEQALQESEAKFRDYAETASDWFWEIDPDYKFTLLTENAFGSASADRIGKACWDHALDLETEPEKWRLIRATLDSRQPFRDFVYCSAGPDGSPMHVRTSGKPVFYADGEFRGYRGTGTDVTAIVRAREEHERLRELESDLAHMNRVNVMGELAGSLVHEITQPIATARNNARAAMHFLDRNPPDLSEVREAVACLVGDADRAGKIIDGVRGHIKKAPLRQDRFDLNDAIKEVIALTRTAIIRNDITARTRLTAGLLIVEGDRVQVQQVVLNLILNATDAMSSIATGSRDLLVSTEQTQPDVVLVAVRDTGPGIDPKDLQRVFETFYTTKSGGMGMGLSISRSIIAAHGGRLWADLNTPHGAVFQFTLPGCAKNLPDSLRTVARTEAPHEDIATSAPRRPASEGDR